MINSQKRSRRNGKKTNKKEETILRNVVSLRISDKEKQVLEKFTRKSSQNISNVIREALELWLATRQRPCLEN